MANRLSSVDRPIGPSNTKTKLGRPNKGVAREVKARKRMEAEERNANTSHYRTRAHRLHNCDPAVHLLVDIFEMPNQDLLQPEIDRDGRQGLYPGDEW